MTYSAESKKATRQRLTIFEIDLPFCANTYGVSPCTAALTDGKIKCFNTRNVLNDCQDPVNFVETTKTYVFSESLANLPASLDVFPCIRSWSISPTRINPDGGVGVRSSLSLTMMDFAHHDRGLDKYVDERTYNPTETGSFWGKFRARNPFYWGATVRLKTGFLTEDGEYDPANFITRHYMLTNISGPDASGNVSIECSDPVKRIDNDRAKFPRGNTGTLSADITDTDTSLTLAPSGVGDEEYPASGKIRIDDEVMSFTRSGDTMTITRAQSNTEADEHDQDSTVQIVGQYTAARAEDIVYDMMVNYAGIDAAVIPLSDWQAESAEWFNYAYTAEITEPEGIAKLINELGKQVGFFLWWDDIANEIKMQALRSLPSGAVTLTDEDHFISGTFSSSEDDDLRITQSWVYHGIIDPTERLDEARNYRSLQINIVDENLYNSEKIDVIYSRWIPALGIAAARDVAARRVNRFKDTPRMVSFSLDLKDTDVWTGSICKLDTRYMQDGSGQNYVMPAQVLAVKDDGQNKLQYEVIEYNVQPIANTIPQIIISTDTVSADVRALYEATIGAVPANPEVRVIIESGVFVEEITGGGFGGTVYLECSGTLYGKAGGGGNGGAASISDDGFGGYMVSAEDGGDGEDGGNAIDMTEDWYITRLGDGIIAGGSGGGGGEAGSANNIAGNAFGGDGGGGAKTHKGTSFGGKGGIAINISTGGTSANGANGADGTTTAAGGNGGNGYAVDGGNGADGFVLNKFGTPNSYTTKGGLGGKAGLLAKTNGHTLTFVEGNDANFVFGDIE